ncbi:Sec-independent protein translocase protein TatB [Pelagibacterium sp. HS1C4-1]|nr:Sec-independent protein translocase protein TatB [Pelagibacterium xiamenense]
MLVLAVVVLIVVGPKDLPVMLRNLGRMMGTVRRMSNEFRREIDKAIALDEVKEVKRSVTEPLRQTSQDINREFNAIRSGKVEPTGTLKPSEPGKESVADEIRARAGMTPARIEANETDSGNAPARTKAAAPSARKAAPRAVKSETKTSVASGGAEPVPSGAKAKSSGSGATKGKSTKTSRTSSGKGETKSARASAGSSAKPAKRTTAAGKAPQRRAARAKAETAASPDSGEN